VHAKKALDRLGGVQRDVQASVAEVDRTKRVYFSEESDALEVATKAQVGVSSHQVKGTVQRQLTGVESGTVSIDR